MAAFDHRDMIRIALALTAAVLASIGCDSGATPFDACANLCDCAAPSGAAERQCNEQCLELVSDAVPQVCLDCIAFAGCNELSGLDPCALECQGDVARLVLEENR
jgi:hypothetical protein